MPGPLASLRVLDFTTLFPGPFATMYLADLGAEVVKVESPDRPDGGRAMGLSDGETSALHDLLGRSKKTIALNLKQPGSGDVVKRLVQTYDILVEQFRPGVMARLGVGYQALSEVNPQLIYCALTGYGQTGPLRERAGHDLNYTALAGVACHIGRRESGPVPLMVPIADISGAATALLGILAAEVHRRETGEGQFVDVSMFDSVAAWNAMPLALYLAGGTEPQREGMRLNGATYFDYYRTRDGEFLSVAGLEPKFWQEFCRAIERPDLYAPGLQLEPEAQAHVRAEIEKTVAQRTLQEWTSLFEHLDACVEPVLSVPRWARHPQTQARGLIVQTPKPDGTTQKQIGSPIQFSRCESRYDHVGAAVGEHTREVLIRVGYSDGEIQRLTCAGIVA